MWGNFIKFCCFITISSGAFRDFLPNCVARGQTWPCKYSVYVIGNPVLAVLQRNSYGEASLGQRNVVWVEFLVTTSILPYIPEALLFPILFSSFHKDFSCSLHIFLQFCNQTETSTVTASSNYDPSACKSNAICDASEQDVHGWVSYTVINGNHGFWRPTFGRGGGGIHH